MTGQRSTLNYVHNISGHSQGLPVSATTAYRLWQLTGLITCVLGFVTHRTGVQLGWVAWGAATAGMVWAAAPGASRTVAVGITALAWAPDSPCEACGCGWVPTCTRSWLWNGTSS